MRTIKPLLIIGGPVDGQRVMFDVTKREYRVPVMAVAPVTPQQDMPVKNSQVADHVYAIGTVQGGLHGVYYVGVQNLNDCVIASLLAGYRKPQGHHTDLNVAEHLVTLLGGESDGCQMTLADNCVYVDAAPRGGCYQILGIPCRDGRVFRVGVLDMMHVDPMALLIEGYRK